jgi:3-dehydroquinate synthetase
MGHAVEKLSNYEITHGEAVAIGLRFAVKLAVDKGKLSEAELERTERLLSRAGLPMAIPDAVPKDQILDVIRHDKKRQGNSVHFILPNKQIGLVEFDSQISFEELDKYLC